MVEAIALLVLLVLGVAGVAMVRRSRLSSPTAADVMAEMKRDRVARHTTTWKADLAQLKNRVFSPSDRDRLWRRARRRLPGEPTALEDVTHPTHEDVEALRGILQELDRDR